jgi:hypothetical protein
MSHLLAHVSSAVQQQQQQQQAVHTAERRRRRQAQAVLSSSSSAPASNAGSLAAAAAAAPAGLEAAVDAVQNDDNVEAYRRQVAAALGAHVSARVPLNSSLVPHVLHILQDEVRWTPVLTVSHAAGCAPAQATSTSYQHKLSAQAVSTCCQNMLSAHAVSTRCQHMLYGKDHTAPASAAAAAGVCVRMGCTDMVSSSILDA